CAAVSALCITLCAAVGELTERGCAEITDMTVEDGLCSVELRADGADQSLDDCFGGFMAGFVLLEGSYPELVVEESR
ncbi:MAG: hypothetical protein K6C36_04475, partial [Clostridia bacterium]|nr:hypothetical protein [Clostridia bacterium]